MRHVEPIVSFKVCYRLNPNYEGQFQIDKIGKGGVHGEFGPSHGGLHRAKMEAENCKKWFNEEKHAFERMGASGKPVVEVRTTIHDNVIVWIEKYKDGYLEEEKCVEKEKEKVLQPA